MNRKLGIIALVIILAVGAVWLFQKPAAPAPKVAEAPKPAPSPIEAPKSVSRSQVAAPVAAPVAAKGSAASAPTKPAGDPQAELNTAFADMISLIQSQDMLTAIHRYLPPDFLAKMPPQEVAAMEQEMTTGLSQPEAQQGMQMIITVLQGMQTQTPSLNETGDRATYQVSDPSGGSGKPEPFVMRKIDGKWYVDPEAMGAL